MEILNEQNWEKEPQFLLPECHVSFLLARCFNIQKPSAIYCKMLCYKFSDYFLILKQMRPAEHQIKLLKKENKIETALHTFFISTKGRCEIPNF